MYITDLNGQRIEIDNLQLAIMQADDYRNLEYLNPTQSTLAEKQREYWEDIYQKLLKLKP